MKNIQNLIANGKLRWLNLVVLVFLSGCKLPPIPTSKHIQPKSQTETLFASLNPIIAFRTGPQNTIQNIIAGSPDGVFTPVITLTERARDVRTYAAPMLLHDNKNLVLWRVDTGGGYNGSVGLYENGGEKNCPNRILGNTYFTLEAQPVLAEEKNVVYALMPNGMSARSKTNPVTCEFSAIDDESQPRDFPIILEEHIVSYCPSKQVWAMGSTIFEFKAANAFKKMASIKEYKAAEWSPDCNQLLAYDAKGWYLFDYGVWDKPKEILQKDFSQVQAFNPTWAPLDESLVLTRPSWSPDQKHFVYSTYYRLDLSTGWPGQGTVFIVDIDKKSERVLVENAVYPFWQK